MTYKEINVLQKVADRARPCDKKAHAFTVPMWFRLWYNHSYVSRMLPEKTSFVTTAILPWLWDVGASQYEEANDMRDKKNNNPV